MKDSWLEGVGIAQRKHDRNLFRAFSGDKRLGRVSTGEVATLSFKREGSPLQEGVGLFYCYDGSESEKGEMFVRPAS